MSKFERKGHMLKMEAGKKARGLKIELALLCWDLAKNTYHLNICKYLFHHSKLNEDIITIVGQYAKATEAQLEVAYVNMLGVHNLYKSNWNNGALSGFSTSEDMEMEIIRVSNLRAPSKSKRLTKLSRAPRETAKKIKN